MTLAEAVAALELEFGATATTGEPTTVALIGSGGAVVKDDDPPPALCLTERAAIGLWFDEMLLHLMPRPQAWYLLDGPHLDRWKITVQDEMFTQRLAEDRFSVMAEVGIVRKPQRPSRKKQMRVRGDETI